MPIHALKMGVLGDFGPLNVIIYHRDLQKDGQAELTWVAGYIPR